MSARSVLIEPEGPAACAPFTRTFRVRHGLVGHPRLTLAALAGLAAELDDRFVEQGHDAVKDVVGFGYRPNSAPSDKRQAVLNIAGQSRIIYLDHIETIPRYQELVDELAPHVASVLGLGRAEVADAEGYLFISGAPSRTSSHIDHECNILMVLEGTKRVWLSDIPDPDADRAVESMYSGRYGYCDRRPATFTPHDVHAGEGIFIAPRCAHMVENQPGRCIALSIVVKPKFVVDEGRVFRANARMRSVGLRPRPPGESAAVDAAKLAAESTLARLRSLVKRAE